MSYEFLRGIADGDIDVSSMDEASMREFKKEYDSARKEGFKRGDALKFTIAVNAYRDDLREKQGMESREKDYKKAAKDAAKAQKAQQKAEKKRK